MLDFWKVISKQVLHSHFSNRLGPPLLFLLVAKTVLSYQRRELMLLLSQFASFDAVLDLLRVGSLASNQSPCC